MGAMIAYSQLLNGMNNGWCQKKSYLYFWVTDLLCLFSFHAYKAVQAILAPCFSECKPR